VNVRLIPGIVRKLVTDVHTCPVTSRPANLVTTPERFTAIATAVATSAARMSPDTTIIHFRLRFLPSIILPSVVDDESLEVVLVIPGTRQGRNC
jgi:hypothetical protein